MTAKIERHVLRAYPSLEAEIAHYAASVSDWVLHEAKVKKDARKNVADPSKHIPYPRPVAHPVVMSAVSPSGSPDYEIVDDPEIAAAELARKKQQLAAAVSQAEIAAIDKVRPRGKLRLDAMREADILSNDQKILDDAGIVGKVKDVIGIDRTAELERKRTKDHSRFLAQRAGHRRQFDEIQRAAAEAQDAIEDLTAETIDSYQIPTF